MGGVKLNKIHTQKPKCAGGYRNSRNVNVTNHFK